MIRKLMLSRKKTLIFDSNNKYTQWLIFKFIPIKKRARCILKQLAKMIIKNGMTLKEKEVLIKMLYN